MRIHEEAIEEKVLAATKVGLYDIEGNEFVSPFSGSPVTAIHFSGEKLAVVVNKSEVWEYDGTWTKWVNAPIKINTIHYYGKNLLAGTSKARLAVVGPNQFDFIESFDRIPERKYWSTPWGSPPDCRSISVSKDGSIYVDVHVGWISRSTDRGATWNCLTEGLEMDVHEVFCPEDPNRVIAATADGFYFSNTRGDSFEKNNEGLSRVYSRAIRSFARSENLMISCSGGPFGSIHAGIYYNDSINGTWQKSSGLPENLETNINTNQLAVTDDNVSYAVVKDTDIYRSTDLGMTWNKLPGTLPPVNGLCITKGF